jgi:hypothetical protein
MSDEVPAAVQTATTAFDSCVLTKIINITNDTNFFCIYPSVTIAQIVVTVANEGRQFVNADGAPLTDTEVTELLLPTDSFVCVPYVRATRAARLDGPFAAQTDRVSTATILPPNPFVGVRIHDLTCTCTIGTSGVRTFGSTWRVDYPFRGAKHVIRCLSFLAAWEKSATNTYTYFSTLQDAVNAWNDSSLQPTIRVVRVFAPSRFSEPWTNEHSIGMRFLGADARGGTEALLTIPIGAALEVAPQRKPTVFPRSYFGFPTSAKASSDAGSST